MADIHDFSGYQDAVQTDLRAVQTVGAALEGTGKPFVITSGTLMLTFLLPAGRVGTEKDVPNAASVGPRIASEYAAIALAERGVRSSVVRLSPSVRPRFCLGSHQHCSCEGRSGVSG